jgi:hypothetical protein
MFGPYLDFLFIMCYNKKQTSINMQERKKIMKKILTIALTAVMLLSMLLFTSCDANSFTEMGGGTSDSAITPTETTPTETTPEEPTPPAPKRYTITEAEWEAILNSTNYTWKAATDSTYKEEYFVRDNVVCVIEKHNDVSKTSYIENKNGTIYEIIDPDNNSQWVAFEYKNTFWDNTCLGVLTGLNDSGFFEIVQYNEATKSYIYEEDSSKVEFCFEDGKLVKGSLTDSSNPYFLWVIENVGTTVVTLPEYTFAEE